MKKKRLWYTGSILIFLAFILYMAIRKVLREEDETGDISTQMLRYIEEKELNFPDKKYSAQNEEKRDGLAAHNDWNVRI